MENKEKYYALGDILGNAPAKWIGKNFEPINHTEDVEQVLLDLAKFTRTPEGKKLKGDMRKKLHNFAYDKAYKPDGATYVHVGGTYTIGTSVKNLDDIVKLGKRYNGAQLYAEAGVYGLNQALKERKFVHKDDNTYNDRATALLAMEADSVSSKGPYDGGDEETAIKTVDTVLTASAGKPFLDEELIPFVEAGLNRRISEYKGYVDANYTAKFEGYVDYMKSKQLHGTMRGFPFLEAGNAKLKKYQYLYSIEMFKHVNNFPFTADNNAKFVGKLTIDQFIQEIMVWLNAQGLKMSEWFSVNHTIIIPISRDQGAPFKVKWSGKEYQIYTRGDRKYRLVTPISAFAQAWLIVVSANIIEAAPSTEGRAGLQEPSEVTRRMLAFIKRAEERSRVLISTDFSTYDATLPSWMMQASCSAHAMCYNDPVVQDGLHMMGVVASQKIMILPISKFTRNKPYDKHTMWYLPYIKGDRNYAIDKTTAGMKHSKLKSRIRDIKNRFDYVAAAFYIYYKYLPSGLIGTNLIGSDCTILQSRELVPRILNIKRLTDKGWISPIKDNDHNYSVGSGDDCVQEDCKEYYDKYGYQEVLKDFEYAYNKLGMVVNPSKQQKIMLNNYPLIDYLQMVFTQYNGDEEPEYRKFMRQYPALPYKERYSRLYLLLQWVIPWGKLESALCDENIDFASSVVSHAGKFLHDQSRKKGYRPPVPIQYWSSRSKLFWNKDYIPYYSPYLGMEQFIGLVKKYGHSFLPSIVRYSIMKVETPIEELVSDFSGELETRAPHRSELARILFESLSEDEQRRIGYEAKITSSGYISKIPSFLSEWEKKTGVAVDSVELDEPLVGAEVQHQDADDGSEEDVPIGVDENAD